MADQTPSPLDPFSTVNDVLKTTKLKCVRLYMVTCTAASKSESGNENCIDNTGNKGLPTAVDLGVVQSCNLSLPTEPYMESSGAVCKGENSFSDQSTDMLPQLHYVDGEIFQETQTEAVQQSEDIQILEACGTASTSRQYCHRRCLR